MAKTDPFRDADAQQPDDPGMPTDAADNAAPGTGGDLEAAGRSNEPSISEDERILPMNRPEKLDSSRLRSDAVATGEDVVTLARQAVEAIRQAADAFAAQAGVKTDEAVAVARAAGTATVDSIGAVADDARSKTEEGIEALGRSIARNPVTALAIAAGAGVLIGWMTRSDERR